MAAASYGPATTFTVGEEGDYSNRPEDSGNWSSGEVGVGTFIGSRWGCGAPATIAYMKEIWPGFVVDADWMRQLPRTVYDGMAKANYWMPIQAPLLPAGLDLSLFDDAWNTGVETAARKLQGVLGTTQDGAIGPVTLGLIETAPLPPIAQALTTSNAAALQKRLGVSADGSVGPITLRALAAQPLERVPLLLLALSERQDTYYRSLSNADQFLAGWLARTSRRLQAAIALHDSA
jgi:lysozyme family protein